MAGMAFFYVAGYLIEERRRWPVITVSIGVSGLVADQTICGKIP